MLLPTPTDYKRVLDVVVSHFQAQEVAPVACGRPFTDSQRVLLRCFLFLHLRRISTFKAQHRWLLLHREQAYAWGLEVVPHRTTLLRRYRQLAPWLEKLRLEKLRLEKLRLEKLIVAIAQWAQDLGAMPDIEGEMEREEICSARTYIEDKSLFRANGPVWHQKDRVAHVVPAGLRNLDQDASWSKSAYHGWVYGYGLHLTVNTHSFPLLAQVEIPF